MLNQNWWHDSAAVLVQDGVVIAAVEEERLNRMKHTNRFPQMAISACLAEAGIDLDQVERIAYYGEEDCTRAALTRVSMNDHSVTETAPASVLGDSFVRALGVEVAGRLQFVNHHMAHAASAHRMSGWSDCLVLTIDGRGDRESGSVISVRDNHWETLRELPPLLALEVALA